MFFNRDREEESRDGVIKIDVGFCGWSGNQEHWFLFWS